MKRKGQPKRRKGKPGVGRQRGGIAPMLATATPALAAGGKAVALGGLSALTKFGINAVSELAMNTLRGSVKPGRKTVSRLKPYRQSLRIIANPRQSIKKRRHLMSSQIGAGAWKELHRCYHCARRQYET